MTLSKLDQAIATINYILRKRKKKVQEMDLRLDLNENQKIFIGQEYELIKNVEFLITQCKNDINAELGRIPPRATDLENQVIGACILFAGTPTDPALNPVRPIDQLRSFLKPEHFHIEANKIVYKAVLETLVPSLINIVTKLRKDGMIDIVGGPSYVASLSACAVSSADIEYHARVLVEMAIKRQLIVLAGEMMRKGYDDTADCFELLEDSEKEFLTIRSWIKK